MAIPADAFDDSLPLAVESDDVLESKADSGNNKKSAKKGSKALKEFLDFREEFVMN